MAKKIAVIATRGGEASDVRVVTTASPKTTAEEIALVVNPGKFTSAEALESIRQIEATVRDMDWPGK